MSGRTVLQLLCIPAVLWAAFAFMFTYQMVDASSIPTASVFATALGIYVQTIHCWIGVVAAATLLGVTLARQSRPRRYVRRHRSCSHVGE